jgi:transposase-like protein
MALSELQEQAVQLVVLDRWNPKMANDKIAKTLGVDKSTVFRWRKDPEFDKALQTELERDRADFDEVPLAWRKNRVLALEDLYDKIDDARVSLKLKVLKEIREEVGDHRIQVDHTVEIKGANLPPRAESYEEWLQQNNQMVEANYTVDEAAG